MKSISTVCLAFLSLLAFARSKPENKTIKENLFATCYSDYDFSENAFTILDNIGNLAAYGVDNTFSTCCFGGVWLFYDEFNYNQNNPEVFYAKGNIKCGKYFLCYRQNPITMRG